MTDLLENAGFMTRTIHAGELQNDQFGALTTPIYRTTTFRFENTDQGINRFKGEETGYVYSRSGNPTTTVLEEKVAALEGGRRCCGMLFRDGIHCLFDLDVVEKRRPYYRWRLPLWLF